MKYLKKRKLYDLATRVLSYDSIPVCAACSYSFRRGYEWLTFYVSDKFVRFTVLNCGAWMRVVEKDDYDCVVRDEVLARFPLSV